MLPVLNLTVVTMFAKLYIETSDPRRFTLYRPQCPPGYCSLGDYAQRSEKGTADHTNSGVALCVRTGGSSPLVAVASGYTQIWSSERQQRGVVPDVETDDEDAADQSSGANSGSGHVETLAFWKPRGPGDDYVAVGHVATTTFEKPPLDTVCVVHKAIATQVESADRIWTETSGAASLWTTAQAQGHLKLFTFFSSDRKSAPARSEIWSLTSALIPPSRDKLVTKKIPKEGMALIHQGLGGELLRVYAPRAPTGYAPLGHYAEGPKSKRSARRVMVVRVKNGSALTTNPLKYRQLWSEYETQRNRTVAFWRPVPPPGYACLGDVFHAGPEPPSRSDIVCLHWSVLCSGRRGARVWTHKTQRWGTTTPDATIWRASPQLKACKAANTFVLTRGAKEPRSPDGLFHAVQRNLHARFKL